jgi:hypothetical protein
MSTPGIRVRHRQACRSHAGGRCNCDPTYEAWIASGERGKKIRAPERFKTLDAAKQWRVDAQHAFRRGGLNPSTTITVREAAAELIDGMERGTIRTRTGDPYKPSVRRGYESSCASTSCPTSAAPG